MKIKLHNPFGQARKLQLICTLICLFCTVKSSYAVTGDTQSDPIVAGTFSAAFSYSNSQNTADFTNAYTARTPNDVYYKFTLNKKMEVTISHCGSTLSDTYVSLLDASGKLIAYNDDYSGTGACSSTTRSYLKKELDAGTYSVVSEGYSQNGVIQTSISGVLVYVQGDSFQDPINAGSFDTGFQYSNTQNTANYTNTYTTRTPNDVFYKFTLTRKMLVTMTHCGSTLADTYMSFLDASGNLVVANDDYSGDGRCSETGTLWSFIQRTLEPGTYYVVSEGYSSSGIITTNISGYAAEEFGYPDIPSNYSSESTAVASAGGALGVSPTGGATYSIPIEVPTGVGGMQPSVSIAYNSQSGNGLAGWGTNLSGFSVITRAPKDIYHDGEAKALTHLADEAYYLDGQRLIYDSGTAGQEGATYYPESDPFTKVVVHGTYSTSTANTWFEVQSPNGIKSYYGSTAGARQSYTYNSSPRINAWYMDYVEDPVGNYMNYTYNNYNYFLCPATITYGKNKNEANSLQNTVNFGYEYRSNDPQPFVLEESLKGSISYRLKTITSKTGSSTFRTYNLAYDVTSDGSSTKFSRLTSVTEKNGAGEALNPLKLNWAFLPAFTQSVNTLNLASPIVSYAYDASDSIVKFTEPYYQTGDLNGDGLADLISTFPRKIKINISGRSGYSFRQFACIHFASINASGSVEFTPSTPFQIGDTPFSNEWFSSQREFSCAFDFDGDGINEYMVADKETTPASGTNLYFKFINWNQIGTGGRRSGRVTAQSTIQLPNDEMPFYCVSDFNNDGKSDVFYIIKQRQSDRYSAGFRNPEVNISFDLPLPSDPKKIFTSDFNADGLTDLLIFYDGGYTIFWNQGGGLSASTLSDSKKTTGTNIGNVWMIKQGDFNGDGLPDFLITETDDNKWYFALNNGNGTFTKTLACTLEVYDHGFTDKDQDKMNCLVYDFDLDGKSDVVINKAMYKIAFRQGVKLDKTYTYWMRSTGSALTQVSMASSNREDDGYAYRYLLDDFNGDGQPELMNYGYNCYNSTDADVDPSWRLYKNGSFSANSGKVTSVTDGLGATTSITYASLVSGGIYTKGSGSTYPMVDYTIPIHAVKMVTTDNGVAGSMTTNYAYAGLKAHLQGKGLLGMTSQKATNTTLGTVTESGVKAWNTTFYIPSQTYSKTTVNGETAETTVNTTVVDKGFKKYFAYPSSKTEKDLDGNTVTTTYGVNTTYGYAESETADFGGGMYKSVQYGNYVLAGGAYRPQLITKTQKHADDSSPFTQTTAVTYDTNKGWKTQVVENYQSSLPVTTNYTYDSWGNVLASVSSGTGIVPVTKSVEYDPTKRFAVRSYTDPASTVSTFTYDTWGNVLTENDETIASSVLTTTHSYDNWGFRTSTLSPLGVKTTYAKGWNAKSEKRYFTLVQGTGQPWVKTWYDNQGREVLVESVGEKSTAVKQTTVYNTKGQAVRKQSQTGNLTVTETQAYDGRGRLSSQSSSTGQSSSFSYGNRTATTVANGRTYTKTYDAWGNVKSSVDPVSSVSYAYTSLGKPKTVTSEGAVFSMAYDDIGNQVSLADPNAGTTSYTCDAARRLTRQVDGRGKITENLYDSWNRISQSTVDGAATTYTYGTSGNEAFRLVKQQTGNNYMEYIHDDYGRVTTEKQQVDGESLLEFNYQYNGKGQLVRTVYPGSLAANYTYDAYGNKESTSTDTQSIWQLAVFNGTATVSRLGGTLTWGETRDSKGLLTNLKMEKGSQVLHNMDFAFDGATGNLSSRTGMLGQAEAFTYDNLDRLTDVSVGGNSSMHLDYSNNGNISSKTGIGGYSYGSKPHAVIGVDNTGGLISNSTLSTPFNAFNKVEYIADAGSGYRLDFDYGPDRERWKTVLKQNGNTVKTTIFAGNYEQVTAGGATQRLYYLDGGAIYVKQDGQADKVYYACTDHQGSILKLVDGAGSEVFAATYDAWGKRTVTNNSFAFHRGYTGHEHLPEFGLINMNGRLYDAAIGRFLSCDPYVQMPDFSQNFNRYSYCLNNPLKFTDPSGEIAWFVPIIFAAIQQGFVAGERAQMHGGDFWPAAWKGAAVSVASAAIPFGVGQVFGHSVGSLGSELLRAGAHGLGNGLLNVAEGGKFGAGFATGVAASLAGSAAQHFEFSSMGIVGSTTLAGAGASALFGGDWMAGATQGMNIGVYNHGWVQGPDGILSYELDEVNVYANPWVRISPLTSEIATYLNRQTAERRMGPHVMGLENADIEFDILTLGVGGSIRSLVARGLTVKASTGGFQRFGSLIEKFGEGYESVVVAQGKHLPIELGRKLNAMSPGTWSKVYEAGILNGSKVEVHYFFNASTGEYVNPFVKMGEWGSKVFKGL